MTKIEKPVLNKYMDKRQVLNLIASIVSFGINICISFFLSPFIVSNLGTEAYGYVGMITTFTSFTAVLTTALSSVTSRFIIIAQEQGDDKKANTYFNTTYFVNIGYACLFSLFYGLVLLNLTKVINITDVYLHDVTILWGLNFLQNVLSLLVPSFALVYTINSRFDLKSYKEIMSHVLRAGLLFACFSIFIPYLWYLGLTSLICWAISVIYDVISYKRLRASLSVRINDFSFFAFKEMFSVGIWNSVNQLSAILLTGLDLWIANMFVSQLDTSLLSIAKVIPVQIVALISLIASLYVPKMVKEYTRGDVYIFVSTIKNTMNIISCIIMVPLIGFCVFGEDFYRLWQISLNAEEVKKVAVLSLLTIIPNVFSAYIYPLYSVNTVTGKLKIPVLLTLFISLCSTVIVLVLVQNTTLGIYAVAGVSSMLLMFRIIIFVPIYASYNLKIKWWTFYPRFILFVMISFVIAALFIFIRSLFEITSFFKFFIVIGIAGTLGYIISIGSICILLKKYKNL